MSRRYTIDDDGIWGDTFDVDPKWVDPRRTRTKDDWPYSYDPYFIWKDEDNFEGSHAEYNDRLQQRDHDKYEKACELVEKRFERYTREEVSEFLTAYHGKEIVATALVEGCNVSNGYPYWVFYFKEMA